MAFTQEQLNVQKYNLRRKHIKLELLDDTLKPIDSLEGTAIGGSITGNANNDIRYSGSITIAIPTHRTGTNFLEQNDGYTIAAGGKIWLDKRLRIYVGIENPKTKEIVWNNLGIYYIDKPTRNFSTSEYSVTFDCADQMLKLSGARQGQLTGITTVIPQGGYASPKVTPEIGRNISNNSLVFKQESTSDLGKRNAVIFKTANSQLSTYATVGRELQKFNTSYIGVNSTSLVNAVTTRDSELFVLLTNNDTLVYTLEQDLRNPAKVISRLGLENYSFLSYANGKVFRTKSGSTELQYYDEDYSPSYFRNITISSDLSWWVDVAYGGRATKVYLVSNFEGGTDHKWKLLKNLSTEPEIEDAPTPPVSGLPYLGVDKKTGTFFAYSTQLWKWDGPDTSSTEWTQIGIDRPMLNPNGGGIAFGDNINVSLSWDARYITIFDGDGNTTRYDLYEQGIRNITAECGVSYNYGFFTIPVHSSTETNQHATLYSGDGIHWSITAFQEIEERTYPSWSTDIYQQVPFNGYIVGFPQDMEFGSSVSTALTGYIMIEPVTVSLIWRHAEQSQTLHIYIPSRTDPSPWTDITLPNDTGAITELGDTETLALFDSFGGIYAPDYYRTKTVDALSAVIRELGGIDNFAIYPMPDKYTYLPYDIKVEVGATVLDILHKFKDILGDTWQMYFDRETGTFKVEPIPSGENDPIYEINEAQKITDEQSADFQNVKNQVVVYGRLNNLNAYTDNLTAPDSVAFIGNTLKLTYSALITEALTINGFLFGFKMPAQYNPMLNKLEIYVGSEKKVEGELVAFENTQPFVQEDSLEPNEIYAIRIFDGTLDANNAVNINLPITFDMYSKQQVAWTLVDDNKESPYYINGGIPEPNYYAGLTKSTDGQSFSLTLNNSLDLTETGLLDGAIITFMANQTNLENCTFTVYSALDSETPLVRNAPLKQNTFTALGGRPNVVAGKISNDYTVWKMRFEKYDSVNGYFVLLGRNEKVLTQVFSGGEFDNIYADALALDRCKYELFLHSNLQNQITLGIVPDYVLDVNMRIPYKDNVQMTESNKYQQFYVQSPNYSSEDKFVTSDDKNFLVESVPTNYYLTKSVEYPLGISNSPQTVSAIQIYDNKNLMGDDYKYKS